MNKLDIIFKALIDEEKIKSYELSVLVDLFLRNRKQYVRESTYNFYIRFLGYIIPFLEKRKITNTVSLKKEHVFDFRSYQIDRGLKNDTINKSVSVLNQVLLYAKREKMIPHHDVLDIKPLKKEFKEIKTVDKKFSEPFMSYIDKLGHNQENLKYKIMFNLLVTTGVRISELLKIEVQNINFTARTIYLTYTKNHQHRNLFLTDKVMQLLDEYLLENQDIKYLFESSRNPGVPIILNTVYSFIKRVKVKLNIPHDISLSPHKWRHTFATELIKNKCSTRVVQDLLGHKHISSTEVYTRLNTEELREQFLSFVK